MSALKYGQKSKLLTKVEEKLFMRGVLGISSYKYHSQSRWNEQYCRVSIGTEFQLHTRKEKRTRYSTRDKSRLMKRRLRDLAKSADNILNINKFVGKLLNICFLYFFCAAEQQMR